METVFGYRLLLQPDEILFRRQYDFLPTFLRDLYLPTVGWFNLVSPDICQLYYAEHGSFLAGDFMLDNGAICFSSGKTIDEWDLDEAKAMKARVYFALLPTYARYKIDDLPLISIPDGIVPVLDDEVMIGSDYVEFRHKVPLDYQKLLAQWGIQINALREAKYRSVPRLLYEWQDREADAILEVSFCDTKVRLVSGMKMEFEILENYITLGRCKGERPAHKGSDGRRWSVSVTFISPAEYQGSLWIGKRMKVLKGGKVIGTAVVTEILNSELKSDAASTADD